MQALPNGNAILVGLRERYGENLFIEGWAMEIDSAGNSQWQKSYSAGREVEPIYAAAIDSTGGMYAFGRAQYEEGGTHAAWIMKLVEQGRVARCPLHNPEEVQKTATSIGLEDVSSSSPNRILDIVSTGLSAVPFNVKVTRICPLPHLSIKKSGPKTAVGGVPFTYSLTVTNNADEALTGVEISDRLPAWATYISGGSVTDDAVTWDIGRLEGGAQATEQLTITARQDVTNEEYAVSCAEGHNTAGAEAVVTQIENQIQLPAISTDYCADFYDNFSDPDSDWPIANVDQWRTRYIANKYEIHNKAPAMIGILAPSCARWYYILEADMQWETAPGTGVGLLFNVSADGRSFSTLTLDTFSKSYQYYQAVPDGGSTRTEGSYFIKGGRSKNHLRIVKLADEILVEVNGEHIDTFYIDNAREKTRVGLVTMSSQSNPATIARFDNFSYVWFAGKPE